MQPPAGRLLAVLLPVLASACSSTTVREGIWRLSFVDLKMATKKAGSVQVKPFPLAPEVLRVKLGPADDGEILEMIKLSPPAALADRAVEGVAPAEGAAAATVPAVTPMYADIKWRDEESPATIHIEHADEDWIWRMWGVVTDPENITGSTLSAFRRFDSNIVIEGRWLMRWLREE